MLIFHPFPFSLALLHLSIYILLSSNFFAPGNAATSYINDFIDPQYILSGAFSNRTRSAQRTVAKWALELAARGPWSVVNKTILPPSGDAHDYMSWAPYTWPNCTGVGNTTELTPEEIWHTCPYYIRDGIFNPDVRLLHDAHSFQSLADAVLYNAIAWSLNDKPTSMYIRYAVNFLETWFINPDTRMNPNLNYAQMARGPWGMFGSHTGILDLKCFTKIVTGILIFRQGGTQLWTQELDAGLNQWAQEYIHWLETSPLAVREAEAKNNHGTFFYSQLAALKILVGDLEGAKNVTETYFENQFMKQLEVSGEQPLEARRTRPYHYRNYNIAGMITNARLALYLDPTLERTIWTRRSDSGATIQNAMDFVMQVNPALTNETHDISEVLPTVAAIAASYSDPTGKYGQFLRAYDELFSSEAYFLWNQPLMGGVEVQVFRVANGNGNLDRTLYNLNSAHRVTLSLPVRLAIILLGNMMILEVVCKCSGIL